MKTVNLKKEWVLWVILILPFVFLLFIWDRLPEQIATHWNSKGEADGYNSKKFGALFTPLLNVAIYILLLLIPRIDPRKKNYDLFQGPYFMIRLSLTIFLTTMHMITLYIALGHSLEISKIAPSAVFILLIIMGNYMGNIRSNYFVGIRTPWTLENEEVWKKTHQFAGKLWFILGIMGLAITIIWNNYPEIILVTLIIIIVLSPIVYSYLLYKKIEKVSNS